MLAPDARILRRQSGLGDRFMEVKCSYCGQMNGNDALVCIGCGRTLSSGQTAPMSPPSSLWSAPPEPNGAVWTPPGGPPPWTPTQAPQPPVFGRPVHGHPAPPWPGHESWQHYANTYGQLPAEVTAAQSRAKTAMILGIVGVPCMSIVLGPIALVLGLRARSTLLHFGIENGQGMATAGIVLGTVDVLLGILTFLALLAG